MNDHNQRASGVTGWVVAALAMSSTLFLGVSQNSSSPFPSSTKPANEAKESSSTSLPSLGDPDPLVVLRNFCRPGPNLEPGKPEKFPTYRLDFSSGAVRAVPVKSSSEPRPQLADSLAHLRKDTELEFLIATVPDPVDSKFAITFDIEVEAIQRAYEARGFTLHSSWLPWPRKKASSPDDSSSFPVHREYPGTLLFRRRVDADPKTGEVFTAPKLVLSIVCLVGENPISGPHKGALVRALDVYRELDQARSRVKLEWSKSVPPGTIAIVGPHYSGSQSILNETLYRYRLNHFCLFPSPLLDPFSQISGTATALKKTGWGSDRPRATVVPNQVITQAILNYLDGDRGDNVNSERTDFKHRVAMLRESNTVFGARTRDNASKKSPSTDLTESTNNWIELSFPLSISHLELDLEKLGGKKSDDGLPRSDFVTPRLPLREGVQFDGIAPFDRESASATCGQALRSILTTIEREKVNYVGIVASDGRDTVFLNKLLRRHCPKVRVFATEPGTALIQPEDAYHLRGMLVGSSYPMYPAAQRWTGPLKISQDVGDPIPWNPRLAFPSQSSQGYYNAVLAQFGAKDRMIGYRPPHGLDTGKPAAWVSVIGQGGNLVPVHCYSTYDDKGFVFSRCENASPVGNAPSYGVDPGPPSQTHLPYLDIPELVMLTHVSVASLLGLLLFAIGKRWDKWFAGDLTGGWNWFWRILIILAILFAAFPYTLAAQEAWNACFYQSTSARILTAFSLIIVLELSSLAVLFLGKFFSRFDTTLKDVKLSTPGVCLPRWAAFKLCICDGFLICTLLILAGGIFTWCVWWSQISLTERFFLYVRWFDPSAGMSPVFSMNLLAGAAFSVGWFSLQRVKIQNENWLRCPYPTDPWKQVHQAANELKSKPDRKMTEKPSTRQVCWGVTLLILLPFLAVLAGQSLVRLPSGEGSKWDWLLFIVISLTGLAILLILIRFLVFWSKIRHLIQEISRVPMVESFERVPGAVSKLFGGYLYSQRPNMLQLGVAAWVLPLSGREKLAQRIQNGEASEKPRPTLSWLFGQTSSTNAAAAAGPADVDDQTWLADQLTDQAEAYLNEFPKTWIRRTVDEAYGAFRPKPAKEEKSSSKVPDRFIVSLLDTPDSFTMVRQEQKPDEDPSQKEQFVATVVALYLGQYLVQLRMMVYALSIASPLLLFAVASFPLQPERPRLNAVSILLAAVAAGIFYVLYDINRNGLISRITRTTPDRFTPNLGFFQSTATYVLPVVAVLAAQVFGLFRTFLEPLLGLVR